MNDRMTPSTNTGIRHEWGTLDYMQQMAVTQEEKTGVGGSILKRSTVLRACTNGSGVCENIKHLEFGQILCDMYINW